LLFTYTFVT